MGIARAQIKLFIVGLVGLLPWLTLAQEPLVRQAPPPIEFEQWRRVGESERWVEYSVTFPTPRLSGYPENDVVHIRALLPAPREEKVPVVLVLHYLGATDHRIERSLAEDLTGRGVAAVLITLPYHLARTPAGTFSGQLAIQPDPERLVQTMVQSVQDTRRAIDWILSRDEFDATRIGIVGTSLGAIIASLVYAIEPRVEKATFMLAGVDLANILWHSSRVVTEREELRRRGFTEQRLRDAFREIEPLEYLPERTTGSAFVIGALHDTVIPPGNTEKLISALPNPKVLWLDTGHYGGAFVQRKLLRTVGQFFGDEFEGKEFVPPKHIYAPTIRIGIDVNTATGLQVAAGLDLWRGNARGDVYAAAMVTPRGPQLFIGRVIDRGFSAGVSIAPTRIGVGAFWSAIL